MSNPTNTALNLDDIFSGGEFGLQYGDAASQDEVTQRSSVTSAGVMRPVPAAPAARNAASRSPDDYPDTIYIHWDDQDNFDSDQYYLKPGGTIYLLSTSKDLQVCTYVGETLTPVFGTSSQPLQPPYSASADSGTEYTVLPGLTGVIIFAITTSGKCTKDLNARGDNPTVNVGV